MNLRNFLVENGEDILLRNIRKTHAEWQIQNFKIENKDKISEPVKVSFDFVTENSFPDSSMIYLNPMLAGKISSNPFKKPTRIYPVDFAKTSDEIVVANLKIPDGYIVEELPKSAVYTFPEKAGKFTYSIDEKDGMIRLTSRISIYKTYFTSEQYPYLRELYNTIIQKHTEQVVLKKK